MKEYARTIGDAFDVAIEKVGIEGWRPYRWEVITGGYLVGGCVPFGTYVRGARKGHPRFGHKNSTDRKTVVVSEQDIELAAKQYERKTGLCWNCKGTRKRQAGWSAKEGARYQTCKRCDGTGHSPQNTRRIKNDS